MKFLGRKAFRLALLLVLMLVLARWGTGCIWLAIPSIAYEGYKYSHLANSHAGSSAASSSSSRPATSSNVANDHSIE